MSNQERIDRLSPEAPVAGRAAPRIVRIITRLNVGGPAIQAVRLSVDLERHGFQTVLVHGRLDRGEGDMSYLLPSSTESLYLPQLERPLRPVEDVAACVRLYRLLCRLRPAIVHTHTAKAGAVGRSAAIAYNRTAGRSSPARLVHTYHGHSLEGYFGSVTTRVFRGVERALARRTDRLIAISPRLLRELVDTQKIGRETQYRVIPLGFDLDAFASLTSADRMPARRALDVPEPAPVVAFVGRLTTVKRPEMFVDMAAQVRAEMPDAIFLVAGDGELRAAVARRAVATGVGDSMRFLGWQRDLRPVYAATDVLVLTSRNEGTPVAVIEAMASGVTCVAADVGGVADVIRDDEAGIVVHDADARLVSAAVIALLRDPERRRRIGQAARRAVLDRFGVDRLLTDIVGLYRELLSG